MGKEDSASASKAVKAKAKQSDIATFFGGKPKTTPLKKDGDIKSFFGGREKKRKGKADAKVTELDEDKVEEDGDDVMEVEDVGENSGDMAVENGDAEDAVEDNVVKRVRKRRKVAESDDDEDEKDEDEKDGGTAGEVNEEGDGGAGDAETGGCKTVESAVVDTVTSGDVKVVGKKSAEEGSSAVQGVEDDKVTKETAVDERAKSKRKKGAVKDNKDVEVESVDSEEEDGAVAKVVEKREERAKPDAHLDSGESEDGDMEVMEEKGRDTNVEDDEDEDEGDEDVEEANPSKPGRKIKLSSASKKSSKGAGQGLSLNFDEAPSWKKGQPVPYKFLAEAFGKVEAIRGRLEIQAILTDVFRKVIETTPEDLVPTIYLCSNKLAAAHEGIESGVGETILIKALSLVSGTKPAALKAKFKKLGDLGDVAAEARSSQTTMFPPPPLVVRGVFKELRAIAESHGKSAVEGKKRRILKLMVSATSKNEARYLARALQGKLRINLAGKTVVTSLANAVTLAKLKQDTGVLLSGDGKKKAKLSAKEEEIEIALKKSSTLLSAIYNQRPVWEDVIPALLAEGDVNVVLAEAVKFTPGIPISPMLAKPTKAIADVLDTFAESKFTCEFKYDGERAQVHRLEDGTVKIYSRNAEDLTPKYPDLCSALPKSLKEGVKGASFVLDGESTAYDIKKKIILPFQDLQSRKRKDVNAEDITVKVCVFAFDLLYFNGKSLLMEPLSKRREVLVSSFDEVEGVFMFAKGHDSREPEEITELLDQSIREGCEGLMVKALDGANATYEPANRSQNWLKVKKDYLAGMGDTLDLVPIGAYTGKGKRTGTFGGFLLACYDPENEEYQSICKIGTGFSDMNLENFTAFFKGTRATCLSDVAKAKESDGDGEAKADETDGGEEGVDDDDDNSKPRSRILDGPRSYYRTGGGPSGPDVWLDACVVWEVACADLSISPLHQAARGLVEESKGISLRFPRFLRVRDDKRVDEATDAEQVAELYSAQAGVANKK